MSVAAVAPLTRPLEVRHLGTVRYAHALQLQADLVRRRRTNEIADRLLLLEHPHVFTLGTSAKAAHVLLDAAERDLLGIELFDSGRGGDVTYHGPGQLVAYPILDLKPDRCDLHRYVRDIEAALIRALLAFDIDAQRSSRNTGVWVRNAKIAAIGVRVSSGWITSHGFALNVGTDLRFFDGIVPCGIAGCEVTSIEQCTGGAVDMKRVRDVVARAFGEVFERRILE